MSGSRATGTVRSDALRVFDGDRDRLEEALGKIQETDEALAPVLSWASWVISGGGHDLKPEPLTAGEARLSGGSALRGLCLAYVVEHPERFNPRYRRSPPPPPGADVAGRTRGRLRLVGNPDRTKERQEARERTEYEEEDFG